MRVARWWILLWGHGEHEAGLDRFQAAMRANALDDRGILRVRNIHDREVGSLLKIQVLFIPMLLQKHLPDRRSRQRQVTDDFGWFFRCGGTG